MPRIKDHGNAVLLWASARDTEDWATRPGASWPCSTLRGRRFFAAFDDNGLCELTVDGKDADDIDGHELSACCADMLSGRIPEDHPVHFVAVGQFQAAE